MDSHLRGPTQRHLTTRENATQKTNDGGHQQMMAGNVVRTPSPNPYHQTISKRLGFLLYMIEREKDIGEVLYGPLDVVLEENEIYQPDLMFILKDHMNIVVEDRIEGPPDLIIEILSPNTAYYDLRHKKKAYAKYGVREYWIVDPMERSVEIFQNKAEDFALIASAYEEGGVRSGILVGLEIPLTEIF